MVSFENNRFNLKNVKLLAQVFQSREGQVQVKCSIVILLTELYKWGRVAKIVSRAMGISLFSADIFMSR